MTKFRVGDKVVKKSGDTFAHSGVTVVTVSKVYCGNIWFKETGTWLYESSLDLAPQRAPLPTTPEEEHTGGSSSYYTVHIPTPTTPYKLPYVAECNDIVEELDMTPAECNVFKAIWRGAAARQGKKKKGNNAVYDAEKAVFFSARMLVKAKKEADV